MNSLRMCFLAAIVPGLLTQILNGCSEAGEPQAVTVSAPLSIQAFPVANGTNVRAVLKVDDTEYTTFSESNTVLQFDLNLSSAIEHTFSLTVYCSRPGQFSGDVIVATIPPEIHYVSESNPNDNQYTLQAFDFNHNFDADLNNNWDEIKRGYNPKLKETKFNPALVLNNAAGGNGTDMAMAVSTLATGGWVVAGYSLNGNGNYDYDIALWKFTATGQLDTSFAKSGIFTYDSAAGSSMDQANAVASLSDGGWLVAGSTHDAADKTLMTVLKFTYQGLLDTTFADKGVFTTGNAAGFGIDVANAITPLADGGFLVGGFSLNANSVGEMALWKVSANGQLDTTFGNTGVYRYSNGAGDSSSANAVTLLKDGSWVVAGNIYNSSGVTSMAVWKFTGNGALDPSFDTDGVYINANAESHAAAVTQLLDEAWVVAGDSANGNGDLDMTLWKFTLQNTLDASFANNGIFVHANAAGGASSDRANAIASLPDGNFIVAGDSINALGKNAIALWKLSANGILDSHYGKGGVFTHNNNNDGNANNYARGIAALSASEWVVAGSWFNGLDDDAMIW